MKNELTIEESARLIELGVDAKLASNYEFANEVLGYEDGKIKIDGSKLPIFTLTDIISILPKEIRLENRLWCNLKIQYIYEEWAVNYSPYAMSIFRAPELIDALYRLLIWCLTEKKINLKTEKK